MPLILDFEARFGLGIPAMDHVHRELAELLDRMADAGNATFAYLYPDLVNHTHAHFANEEVLMRQSNFPDMKEHTDEHARIRGELDAFGQALDGRRIALTRAFVVEQLPAWFVLHTTCMDSALAAHLKKASRIKGARS